MVPPGSVDMTHNPTKATGREHDRVGSRTLPVEHTATWVDDNAHGLVERRPNDTNANGDRPTRETPATVEDLSKTAGGHFRTTRSQPRQQPKRSEGASK